MRWYHEADPSWLLARRDVITATELKSCLSAYNKATKEQKAGTMLLPAFASLWLQKQSTSPIDVWSNGSAARGHIVEPFAMEDFNKNIGDAESMHMYHWDDVIIKNNGIGWSPDGLSIPQETFEAELFIESDGLLNKKTGEKLQLPKAFFECKCYEPSKHMKQMLTPKMKLEERWQMAVAFVTVPSLEKGYLLFYSIDTPMSFGYWYTRDELEEEIKQIEEMLQLWNKNVENLEKMPPRFERSYSEEDIYEQWQEQQLDVLRL